MLCPGLQLNRVPPATFPSSPCWSLLAWQTAGVTGVPITSLPCHRQQESQPSSQLWNEPTFSTLGKRLRPLAWRCQEKQLDGVDWARCRLAQYWICTWWYKEREREEDVQTHKPYLTPEDLLYSVFPSDWERRWMRESTLKTYWMMQTHNRQKPHREGKSPWPVSQNLWQGILCWRQNRAWT